MDVLITRDPETKEFQLREAATGEIWFTSDRFAWFLEALVRTLGFTLLTSVPEYDEQYGKVKRGVMFEPGEKPPDDYHIALLQPGDVRMRLSGNDTHYRSEWDGQQWSSEQKVSDALGDDYNYMFGVGSETFFRPRQNVIAARLAYQTAAGIKEYSPLSYKLCARIVNNFKVGAVLTVDAMRHLLNFEHTWAEINTAAEELVERGYLKNMEHKGYQYVAAPPQ